MAGHVLDAVFPLLTVFLLSFLLMGGGSQMFELNREFYKNSTFLSMLISTTSSSTDFILQGWNTVTHQNSCVDFVQNMLAWVSTV